VRAVVALGEVGGDVKGISDDGIAVYDTSWQ